jgi:hypothetical protein
MLELKMVVDLLVQKMDGGQPYRGKWTNGGWGVYVLVDVLLWETTQLHVVSGANGGGGVYVLVNVLLWETTQLQVVSGLMEEELCMCW